MARSDTPRRRERTPKGATSLAKATERVNAALMEMLKEHDRELKAIAASSGTHKKTGVVLSDIEEEGSIYLLTRFPAADLASLTERQRQISDLSASGLSTKEIARDLQLSPSTVSTHIRAVYKRLHVDSRAALALRLYQSQDQS